MSQCPEEVGLVGVELPLERCPRAAHEWPDRRVSPACDARTHQGRTASARTLALRGEGEISRLGDYLSQHMICEVVLPASARLIGIKATVETGHPLAGKQVCSARGAYAHRDRVGPTWP